ncbi:MAG: hypothetical protein WC732_06040 [Candidatus Omnitrophota bacterium]
MKKIIFAIAVLLTGLIPVHRSLVAFAQDVVIRNETQAPQGTSTNVYIEEEEEEPVTKEVVVEEDERDGLLGGPVFHIVGEVLAFPFRLVANVIDFIF